MTAPQASATSISLRSDYDYGSIISKAAQSLGYSELKKEQHEAVMKFVTGNDVFISLPTGFGKSLCRATQMSPSLLLRRNRNISAAAATVRHGDLLHADWTNYC